MCVDGEVSEWLKEHAWKVCVRGNSYREFESHPLRQINMTRPYAWSYLFDETVEL